MSEARPIPCAEVRLRLTAFTDGELEGEECWSIRRHLEACPPCGRSAALEQSFKKVLRDGLRSETAPSALASRIRSALAAGVGSTRPEAPTPVAGERARAWALWPLTVAGAGATIGGVLLGLWLAGGAGTFTGPGTGAVSSAAPAPGAAAGIDAGENSATLDLATVHLRCTIVCAACEAMNVPLQQQLACAGYGHLNGLRDDQGRLWHVFPPPREEALAREAGRLQDIQLRGRMVLVDGQAVEKLSYLMPRSVQFL
jgi:anti-sigma factor (TIGR02949 family)